MALQILTIFKEFKDLHKACTHVEWISGNSSKVSDECEANGGRFKHFGAK